MSQAKQARMSQSLTIARRELKAYFLSPVALIFLGTFLFVTLFTFFWVDAFFRRNIADIRPLFHWLPILLIFLVGALTMRLWSEEQRSGTIEVLMTLPVRTSRLVLGKFFAGLALVAVALLLTLGVPISVSMLGDLDWGPVLGGYLGALLLAGTYLSIGLCFSAGTDNPIVALILTCVACGLLYVVGSETVVSHAGIFWGEILRGIGSGSRFESIQRGVIDLRDLVYYGALTVAFLFLNVVILEAKRWSGGRSTRPKRNATKLAVVLVFGNIILLNVILTPLGWARVDLTERDEYSISPVTKKLLKDLDAPVLVRGYFSEKTHPLLAPLVPRIRDMIKEYAVVGGDRVTTEFVDPRKDEQLEKEAKESYGIRSVPFQFADRHEAAVVNSYFSILVKCGDKYETLGFEDLIEVSVTSYKDIEVKLRNLEYDLTRTIKKVAYGFQPLETLFARAPGKITLTAYVTAKHLPKVLEEVPKHLAEVAEELTKRGAGKFALEQVDPSGKPDLQRELHRKYGFKPMAVSLFSDESFYLHLLVRMGDRVERVLPAPEMSKADLREEIVAAMKRLTPGFLKTVGLLLPEPVRPPPRQHPMMPPPRDINRFELVKEKLSESYTAKDVDLKDGRVPGDVDVLLVVGGRKLDDKQRYAIDQFLMRGGAVVVCLGSYALDPMGMGQLRVKREQADIEQMLASWGVKIAPKMVLDPQNEAFPVPVEAGMIQLLRYPFWVDVRRDGMAHDSPILGGLPAVTVQWGSPLELVDEAKRKGIDATVLLRSTKDAWTQDDTNVQPDFERFPKTGFGPTGGTGSEVLAVALSGSFKSTFADKPSPLFEDKNDKPPSGDPTKDKQEQRATSRTTKSSPKGARLVVVGSSSFVNDVVLGLSRQTGTDRFINNLQLVQNVVDWSVADVDLLSIRSRGTFARTLEPLSETARSTWEGANYALVVLALGVIIVVSIVRRRSVQPMKLSSRSEEV